jgi:hypothetical protein
MVDLLSWPPTRVFQILEVRCASYGIWKELYAKDPQFGEIWAALHQPTMVNQTPFLDYTSREG